MFKRVNQFLEGFRSVESSDLPLRIAVVGTPRSGNTWTRCLMATAYDFPNGNGRELAVPNPLDLDWETAGKRYIVQVLLPCEQRWFDHFHKYGVRILVPIRHPFDVLISILRYASQVNTTNLWLASLGGSEDSIKGLHPCHPKFIEYARSLRAKCLLELSTQWSQVLGATSFHYEDLVARPARTLAHIENSLGTKFHIPWKEIVAANTLDHLRSKERISNPWQGKAGLWKRLLTKKAAEAIAEAHRPILKEYQFGFTDFPSSSLTADEALANFQSLE